MEKKPPIPFFDESEIYTIPPPSRWQQWGMVIAIILVFGAAIGATIYIMATAPAN